MRKIVSKEKEFKRKKRNATIVGVVLVVIMFGSTFGIVVNSFGKNSNSEDKIIYNGFTFQKSSGYWFTTINEVNFAFRYNPEEINFSEENVNDLSEYSNKPLYIYSLDEASRIEVYRNMQYIVLRMQEACFEGLECPNEEFPTKTCEDNFIIIQEANESSILQNESCVFIKGEKEDLVKVTDEFLFKTIGIKE